MKYLEEKDRSRRSNFMSIENHYRSIKSLIHTRSKNKFYYLKMQILNANNTSYISINNRCIISNRARSVLSWHHLSRIKFREKASTGELCGVKKASW